MIKSRVIIKLKNPRRSREYKFWAPPPHYNSVTLPAVYVARKIYEYFYILSKIVNSLNIDKCNKNFSNLYLEVLYWSNILMNNIWYENKTKCLLYLFLFPNFLLSNKMLLQTTPTYAFLCYYKSFLHISLSCTPNSG